MCIRDRLEAAYQGEQAGENDGLPALEDYDYPGRYTCLLYTSRCV